MNKKIIFTLLLGGTLLSAFILAPHPHVETYNVDTKASKLQWNAKKLTGEHHGTIQFTKGQLYDDHGRISGTFEIDMTTITVDDLSGGSKEKLEKHLRSEDFFDIKNHPISRFALKSLSRGSSEGDAPQYIVKGDLTIKGNTKEIWFPAEMNRTAGQLSFAGEAVIDRTEFDIKYRSKKFFPNIGDKMIYDDFTLKFDLVFVP